MTVPIPLPAEVLSSAVRGRNLAGAKLSENLAPNGTLLVFLRHLG